MTLLTGESVCKRFPQTVVLNKASFTIASGDRIALVGANGAGKTTLLELIAGLLDIDTGTLTRSRDCVIDYVEQDKTAFLDDSLYEYVSAAREDLLEMQNSIENLEIELSEDPNNKRTLAKLGEIQQRFEQDGGFELENNIKGILTGLGFEKHRFAEPLREFSGGEMNRAGLARALAGKGSLLLLDEPTNHLDIESTRWLEEYLQGGKRACVVVSHDRAFLTAVADRVWELDQGSLEGYSGGFASYLKDRAEKRRLAEHRYKHQQEEIARIEEFIRRNMAGQKTKQAQSKQKRLAKVKRLPPPRKDKRRGAVKVITSQRSGAVVLRVRGLALGYDGVTVIENTEFEMYRGDKVGLVGRNGSGKSTLVKGIIGEIDPVRGKVEFGYNVDVAYFDQNLSDLPKSGTVLDALWSAAPLEEANRIRAFLARFGYSGEGVFKSVSALSGGEKTKLCLARMLFHPANLIILDEPTNHLDIDARVALEEGLSEFEGSLLVVSHDRAFLNRVTHRTLLLKHGRTHSFEGSYSQIETYAHVEDNASGMRTGAQPSKEAYIAFKERSRRISKTKKRIEDLRHEISRAEDELAKIEESLVSEIPKSDWERLNEVSQHKEKTERMILEMYARLEELIRESDSAGQTA